MDRPEIKFQKQDNSASIANYFALDIAEYFFDNILENQIPVEKFIYEFKDELQEVIKQIILNQNNKLMVSNVFNYYAVISIDKSKPASDKIFFLDTGHKKSSDEIQKCLDDYFHKDNNQEKLIKSTYKNMVFFLTPLTNLNKMKWY